MKVTSSDIKVGVDISNVVFVFMDATINVDESKMLHWFNGMMHAMKGAGIARRIRPDLKWLCMYLCMPCLSTSSTF